MPRSHVKLIISGTTLYLSLILTFSSALAGNSSSYRYSYNGATIISISLPSIVPQTDNPTSTTEPTASDNPTPTTSTTDTDKNSIPFANHDNIITAQNTPVNISILANDSGLNDTPLTLSILTLPEHGLVTIGDDHSIIYTPDSSFTGADSLIYEVMDNNGEKAIANATIEVQCNNCPPDIILTLTWNPNPDAVLGYAVYFGPSAETAIQLASELSLTSGLLDPLAPGVQYRIGDDLGLVHGDIVCFRLKAYNESGYSGFSGAACTDSVI